MGGWHSFIIHLSQFLIYGLSLGAVYALIAVGYTMVYGIVKLINFAHGDVYMVGAYLGYFSFNLFRSYGLQGWSWLAAIIVAMLGCALLGVIIERVAYKPLRVAPRIAALTTAIGVSLFLEYGMMALFTPQQKYYAALPGLLADKTFHIQSSLVLQKQHIIFFFVSILLAVILYVIVHRTKAGKGMRAASYDKEAAQLMGINVDRTISLTFALGSIMAAAGGVLFGSFYPIDPLLGFMPGMKAFVAAVVGGIGSIPGAVLGGLLMGVVESLVTGFLSSTLRDVVAFAILILILIVKPTGLLGKPSGEKV